MRELQTIQTQEKLNRVFAVDEKGSGNANHIYKVELSESVCKEQVIHFQNGPRKDTNSVKGVLDTDLLEIVRDRLIGFQEGPYASDYNAEALEHIEKALEALNRRVDDRVKRGVLGTDKK